MKSRNHYPGMLPYAVEAVRHWALRLTRHPAFCPSDLEDLEQELMLDLHRRIPGFNPDKASLPTFISRVVAHCAASLIRRAATIRRGGRQNVISLNTHITNTRENHPLEVIDAISSQQDLWSEGRPASSDVSELRIDMRRILGRLPSPLQQLASRLLGETVTEIAHATGTPRATLYDAIGHIRAAFTKAGYGKGDLQIPRMFTPVTLRFAVQGG